MTAEMDTKFIVSHLKGKHSGFFYLGPNFISFWVKPLGRLCGIWWRRGRGAVFTTNPAAGLQKTAQNELT